MVALSPSRRSVGAVPAYGAVPLLELPEALQQCFAEQVPDATTAGRVAQASHVRGSRCCCSHSSKRSRRRAALQQSQSKQPNRQSRRSRKREMILSCFEQLEEGAMVYRCIIHQQAMDSTLCRCIMRAPACRKLATTSSSSKTIPRSTA